MIATRPATILRVDGTHVALYPPKGSTTFTLAALQEAVGGYIERVHSGNPKLDAEKFVMFCNEEGRIHGLPLNSCATRLTRVPIVGDAILVPAEALEND